LSREEDLTKGILSTPTFRGQHAEELILKAPGMGGRWVTDIIADNDPDDESYFPYEWPIRFQECSSSFQ
jgi:3-oxoacyl-[acyl-carrier-protein] synthase-3